MKRITMFFVLLYLIFINQGLAQERPGIKIPDILGFTTLTCDLHMHTVFSDGQVWPTVRIEEAFREGIQVISITDHIEYRPHFTRLFTESGSAEKPRIIPDHNMSYEVAKPAALKGDIILIKGSEITRSMPPGHSNAIFLTDNNKLDTPEWKDAFLEAKKQGAFIFWNHPGWRRQQPDTTLWWEEHTWLLENGMMHGIEVVNGTEYYPEAHQWAIDKNLAFIATTDVHGPIGMSYKVQSGEIRPMTLVFAKEKTIDGVKEALFDRRTLAYYDNKLIGNGRFLDAIFFSSIVVESVQKVKEGFHIVINNHTDIPFELSKASGNDPALNFFGNQTLPAGKQTTMKIYTNKPESFKKLDLKLNVDNLLVAPEKGLPVTLTIVP